MTEVKEVIEELDKVLENNPEPNQEQPQKSEIVSIKSYDAVKIELNDLVKKYENLVVTETNFSEAKKARKAIRDQRYFLQNTEKDNNNILNDLKRKNKSTAEELISIIKPVEERIDKEIKAIEAEKERIKKEKEEAEKKRIEKIKNKIEEIRKELTEKINNSTLEELLNPEPINYDFDFMEFSEEANQMVQEVGKVRDNRVEILKEKEEIRKQKEALKAEQEKLRLEREKVLEEKRKIQAIDKERIEKIAKAIQSMENFYLQKLEACQTIEDVKKVDIALWGTDFQEFKEQAEQKILDLEVVKNNMIRKMMNPEPVKKLLFEEPSVKKLPFITAINFEKPEPEIKPKPEINVKKEVKKVNEFIISTELAHKNLQSVIYKPEFKKSINEAYELFKERLQIIIK